MGRYFNLFEKIGLKDLKSRLGLMTSKIFNKDGTIFYRWSSAKLIYCSGNRINYL